MNTTQKSLLACSAICYALVLFSFLNSSLWLVLIFFILHSLSLLYFTYLTYSYSQAPQIEEELFTLKEQCKQLANENTRLTSQLSQAHKENQQLKTIQNDLEAARQELATASKEPAPEDALFPLLPPIDQDAENQETINIIQVANDTIQEFLPFSAKEEIQILVSASTETLLVKASSQRIRILFRNIIDNSIKYMNQPGTLVITISTVGDDIFIVLKDNGKGLPATETPHIFEINYQGSNRISGNGLGLTQAKAIVDSYGGTIYAKSTEGKGMGIYIQIPIQ